MPGRMQYQYGTNPKKIEPDQPSRLETNRNKKNIKTNKYSKQANNDYNSIVKQKKQRENAINKKKKVNAVIYLVIVFGIVFGIGYRNALLDENFRKVENMKLELSELKKENDQLKVSIESSLNLSNVEQIAKNVLGMRKIDSTQKVFLNIPKREYVEPAPEKVVISEPTLWDKIVKFISNIW